MINLTIERVDLGVEIGNIRNLSQGLILTKLACLPTGIIRQISLHARMSTKNSKTQSAFGFDQK